MPSYEYKLVKSTYRNRIEYEDGPGSLRNIVSNKPELVVLRRWSGQQEGFGKELVAQGFKFALPDSTENGWEDYGYTLYRRLENTPGAEWEYATDVPPNCNSSEDWDEYSWHED